MSLSLTILAAAALALFIAIPGVVILGVVIALVQRLREIGKGDEDAVKKY